MSMGKSPLSRGQHGSESHMKLNFWQIIGVVLLVGGAGWYIYREMNPAPKPNPNPVPAAVTPASGPATQPK